MQCVHRLFYTLLNIVAHEELDCCSLMHDNLASRVYSRTKIKWLAVRHCNSWLRLFCANKISNAGYTRRRCIILPVIDDVEYGDPRQISTVIPVHLGTHRSVRLFVCTGVHFVWMLECIIWMFRSRLIIVPLKSFYISMFKLEKNLEYTLLIKTSYPSRVILKNVKLRIE